MIVLKLYFLAAALYICTPDFAIVKRSIHDQGLGVYYVYVCVGRQDMENKLLRIDYGDDRVMRSSPTKIVISQL